MLPDIKSKDETIQRSRQFFKSCFRISSLFGYNCFYPNSFMQLLSALSLSLYPRIALSFVQSNKILAQSMPRTKDISKRWTWGVECCTADIPIRVNTSFFARIHKRQVVSDTFGDGALEGTTLVSYDDKSISVERFILTLQKQADKLARGTPNFSSKILRGI